MRRFRERQRNPPPPPAYLLDQRARVAAHRARKQRPSRPTDTPASSATWSAAVHALAAAGGSVSRAAVVLDVVARPPVGAPVERRAILTSTVPTDGVRVAVDVVVLEHRGEPIAVAAYRRRRTGRDRRAFAGIALLGAVEVDRVDLAIAAFVASYYRP